MKKYLAPIFCLLLAGCTDADWDHVMSFGGLDEPDQAQAAPPHQEAGPGPATVAGPGEPANADFCRAVATQDANGNDFDRATQSRVYARSYSQCLTLYTR
jgi:hypothetical protein